MTRVHGRRCVETRGDFALGTPKTWIRRRPWAIAEGGDRRAGPWWETGPTRPLTPGTGSDRAHTVGGVDPRHRGTRQVLSHTN